MAVLWLQITFNVCFTSDYCGNWKHKRHVTHRSKQRKNTGDLSGNISQLMLLYLAPTETVKSVGGDLKPISFKNQLLAAYRTCVCFDSERTHASDKLAISAGKVWVFWLHGRHFTCLLLTASFSGHNLVQFPNKAWCNFIISSHVSLFFFSNCFRSLFWLSAGRGEEVVKKTREKIKEEPRETGPWAQLGPVNAQIWSCDRVLRLSAAQEKGGTQIDSCANPSPKTSSAIS